MYAMSQVQRVYARGAPLYPRQQKDIRSLPQLWVLD